MTKLFDLLPGWIWALLLSGAVAMAWMQTGRLEKEQRLHAETRTAHAEQESDRLREALREVSRLTAAIKGAQDAYEQQRSQVVALRDRLRAADQRLRDQQAEHASAIEAAGADGLRRYAQATRADLERCRADIERFGLEAAAGAAAAHALKANLDAMAAPP